MNVNPNNKILKTEFEAATESLISLAFEYANNDFQNVDAPFVFCSLEENLVFTNAYFRIN